MSNSVVLKGSQTQRFTFSPQRLVVGNESVEESTGLSLSGVIKTAATNSLENSLSKIVTKQPRILTVKNNATTTNASSLGTFVSQVCESANLANAKRVERF